ADQILTRFIITLHHNLADDALPVFRDPCGHIQRAGLRIAARRDIDFDIVIALLPIELLNLSDGALSQRRMVRLPGRQRRSLGEPCAIYDGVALKLYLPDAVERTLDHGEYNPAGAGLGVKFVSRCSDLRVQVTLFLVVAR